MIQATADQIALLRSEDVAFTRLINGAGLAHTDHPSAFVYDSITYIPTARVLKTGDFKRINKLELGSLNVEITMADRTYLAYLQANNVFGAMVTIRAAIFNDAGSIAFVVPLYAGIVDKWQAQERANDQSIINLVLTSYWDRFRQVRAGTLSPNEQKQRFPSDIIFDNARTDREPLQWGED